MYFILAMQIRKWICFYAVRKVTDNVLGLGEGGELEVQMFMLVQKLIRIPNVQI